MKTRYLKLGRGKLQLGKICFSLTLLLPLTSIAADDTAHQLLSPLIQTLADSCAACHGINGNSAGGTPQPSEQEGSYVPNIARNIGSDVLTQVFLP